MAVFLATGLTADLAVDLAECLFVGLTTGFVLALVTGVVLLFAGVVLTAAFEFFAVLVLLEFLFELME